MRTTLEMFVIASRDGGRAKEFYETLFNWNISDVGPLLQIHGAGLNGHILKWPHKNHPTHVSIYINVDNIQKCLAIVEEMGGTVILPEMAVPTGGSIAQFIDPDGNIIGIHHGKKPRVTGNNEEIAENHIGFFEIAAREIHRSQKFYEAIFNWNILDKGSVLNISAEDAGMNGHIFHWTHEEPTYVTLYIKVESLANCLEKVRQLGGKVIEPETAIPDGGTFAQFMDLDGNIIGIYNGR